MKARMTLASGSQPARSFNSSSPNKLSCWKSAKKCRKIRQITSILRVLNLPMKKQPPRTAWARQVMALDSKFSFTKYQRRNLRLFKGCLTHYVFGHFCHEKGKCQIMFIYFLVGTPVTYVVQGIILFQAYFQRSLVHHVLINPEIFHIKIHRNKKKNWTLGVVGDNPTTRVRHRFCLRK